MLSVQLNQLLCGVMFQDLNRQLASLQRRVERSNSTSNTLTTQQNGSDVISMGSRTSSNNSLSTIGMAVNASDVTPPTPATASASSNSAEDTTSAHASSSSSQLPVEAEAPLVQFVDVDKQVLVEKIVRLQKTHARKSEKLEFLEEHVNHLVNELQRKTRSVNLSSLPFPVVIVHPGSFADSSKITFFARRQVRSFQKLWIETRCEIIIIFKISLLYRF